MELSDILLYPLVLLMVGGIARLFIWLFAALTVGVHHGASYVLRDEEKKPK